MSFQTESTATSSLMKLPNFEAILQQCTKREKTLLQLLENIYDPTINQGLHFFDIGFGGHGSTSSRTRSTKKILLFPLGLLAPTKPQVNGNFQVTSTVASTEIWQNPSLLAGNVRVETSACRFNCHYKLTSFHGNYVVFLRTIRKLEVGNEMTVFYTNYFLNSFPCQCLPKSYIPPQPLPRNAMR